MRCQVLLFAKLAETTGTARLELDLDEGATAGDALDALAARWPALADARPTLAVAVNEQYCTADRPLRDGDTLALIPPVSGG